MSQTNFKNAMQEYNSISDNKWTVVNKLLLVYFFTYIALYILGFLFDGITYFVGNEIFNIRNFSKITNTGSGDTTFNYVQNFVILILAFILTPVFYILNKKNNYNELQYLFFIGVRLYVGYYMIVYGFAKIFQVQFPFPYLTRLDQSFGDSSPMGLLWTFMGYSPAYNIFAGTAEALGGFLLIYRKTTAFGALILFAVMSNVLVLNFSYDVPVKLFSSNLLLFIIILIAPNIKTLVQFFFQNKSVSLYNYNIPANSRFKTPALNRARFVVKFCMLCFVALLLLQNSSDLIKAGNNQKISPYGLYKTEAFILNEDTLKPAITDSNYWKDIIIDRYIMRVKTITDRTEHYRIKIDSTNKRINFSKLRDKTLPGYLTYNDSGKYLYISGMWKNNSIDVKMLRQDIKKYLLVNRGFHWINEYPYNR